MRKILHVDMDAFFASVEQREHPEWRGKPVIVGGKPNERGVVSTCSYEARAFGVRSAMPTAKAMKLCPKAILTPGNYSLYKEISSQVREVFKSFTNMIEPLSIDEAYLDVTNNSRGITSATLVAHLIQKEVYEKTGLTCSVGVSFNKFLAKMASGYQKPSGITVITPENAQEFIRTIPIGNFYGVGKVSAEKLKRAGIETGEDLLQLSKAELESRFGNLGPRLYAQVRGISNDQLTLYRERKSIGSERTLIKDTTDHGILSEYLEKFSLEIASMLQKRALASRTISLKLRDSNFNTTSKSVTLRDYFNKKEEILQLALQLFEEMMDEKPIRLIGLSVSHLEKTDKIYKQLKLF